MFRAAELAGALSWVFTLTGDTGLLKYSTTGIFVLLLLMNSGGLCPASEAEGKKTQSDHSRVTRWQTGKHHVTHKRDRYAQIQRSFSHLHEPRVGSHPLPLESNIWVGMVENWCWVRGKAGVRTQVLEKSQTSEVCVCDVSHGGCLT